MTAYFDKYRFPPTHRVDVESTLRHFGFIMEKEDEVYRYFKSGDTVVPVTVEHTMSSLTIYETIDICKIDESAFIAALNGFRNNRQDSTA